MSKRRDYIVKIILFGIMIIFYGQALARSMESTGSGKIQMLYWRTEYKTGQKALEMQEQNQENEDGSLNFTVWGTKKKQEIKFAEYGRQAEADAVYLCGDSRLLFDQNEYIDENDPEGCLISADTAYKLFGSNDIRDVPVIFQEKEYIVRGIIKDLESTIAVQADSSTEAILDTTALEIPKKRLASSVINEFEGSFAAADSKVNISAIPVWGQIIVSLLPLMMFIALLIPVVKKAVSLRRMPVKCAAWLIGWVLFGVLFWWLSQADFRLPFDITPSKWSDFKYWGDLFEEQSKAIWNLLIMEKRSPELIYAEQFTGVLKYALISLIIFILFVRNIKINTARDLFVYCICSISCSFAAVLMTEVNPSGLAASSGIWIMPLIYLAGRWFIDTILSPKNL